MTLTEHLAAIDWHSVRLYRLSRRLHERAPGLARLVSALNRVLTGVDIPPSVEIGPGLTVMHGHGIVLHHATVIGSGCSIYQQVTVGSTSPEGAPPRLGNDVVLYPGAKVLGPITIGDGAQVAANAVVIRDVPAGAVVGGVPARRLR